MALYSGAVVFAMFYALACFERGVAFPSSGYQSTEENATLHTPAGYLAHALGQPAQIPFMSADNHGWGFARITNGVSRLVTSETHNSHTLNWLVNSVENPGEGVDVYVLDRGVNDHVDLPNIDRARGRNLYLDPSQGADTTDHDPDGHGTVVAGLIAGQRTGIAKSAKIIPIVFKDGPNHSTRDLIVGMNAVIDAFQTDHGASKKAVINISQKMEKSASGMLEIRINKAIELGMVVINSAGNEGQDSCARRIGKDQGVIMVGATDINDATLRESNFGECLSLWAPGVNVPGPDFKNFQGFVTEGNSISGTSFSAATTSGVVATLLGLGVPAAEIPARLQALAVEPHLTFTNPAQGAKSTKKLLQGPAHQ